MICVTSSRVAMRDLKDKGGHEGPKRCVTSSMVAMRDLRDVKHQVGWP